MFSNLKPFFIISLGTFFVISSCGKKDDSPNPNEVKKEYIIKLTTQQNTYIPKDRTETGIASLKIYADNNVEFSIKVSGLQAGDVLTNVDIQEGTILDNFFKYKNLVNGSTIKFQADSVKAKVQLYQFEVDSLIKSPNKFNITVYSQKAPNGLLRGFFDKELAFGADIPLSSRNINPKIDRTDSAYVRLRVTQDNKLYSEIKVVKLLNGDVLQTTKIQEGDRFTNNGNTVLTIASQPSDYEVLKVLSISSSDLEKLKTQTLYVNTTSAFMPVPGLMRGQLR
ncbi:MAG: hypothetical protein OHK0038_16040 [Flammeovirgaceae bacterium]